MADGGAFSVVAVLVAAAAVAAVAILPTLGRAAEARPERGVRLPTVRGIHWQVIAPYGSAQLKINDSQPTEGVPITHRSRLIYFCVHLAVKAVAQTHVHAEPRDPGGVIEEARGTSTQRVAVESCRRAPALRTHILSYLCLYLSATFFVWFMISLPQLPQKLAVTLKQE